MSRVTLTVRSPEQASAVVSSGGAVEARVGASQGTAYYPALIDKPRVGGVVLVGDKDLEELGLNGIAPQDIDRLIYG